MFTVQIGGAKGKTLAWVLEMIEKSGRTLNSDAWAVVCWGVFRGWIKGKGDDFANIVVEEYLACCVPEEMTKATAALKASLLMDAANGPATATSASGQPASTSPAAGSAPTTQKSGRVK